jgi:hypothetical protein
MAPALAMAADGPCAIDAPDAQSTRVEEADIYAAIEDGVEVDLPLVISDADVGTVVMLSEIADPAAAEPPLADIEVVARSSPSTLAQQIALGIGVGGLAVSTMAVTASVDDPTPGALVFGSITLGVGMVGLITAGLIELISDAPATRFLRSSGGALVVTF